MSLVDAEVVRFLSACESEGIQLLNCSATYSMDLRERENAVKDKSSQRSYLRIYQ